MRFVPFTKAKQHLLALLDPAQREPIVIRRQERNIAVIVSPAEYDRLPAVNVEEFERFCNQIGRQADARGLTKDKLNSITAQYR